MSWTKQQFVEEALSEIGLASYIYDNLQPEQLQRVLRRMDSIMAMWNAKGIRVGYPIPSSPENSSLDDETNVPDRANQAIILNLALQIGPGFGKVVPQETKVAAKNAYDILLSSAAQPLQKQFQSTTPRGAGNKSWGTNRDNFFPEPVDPLQAGNDSIIEFD